LDPYATLAVAYEALGRAALPVIAHAGMKDAARKADTGELSDTEALALAAEVQALAALIGSGKGR